MDPDSLDRGPPIGPEREHHPQYPNYFRGLSISCFAKYLRIADLSAIRIYYGSLLNKQSQSHLSQ